MENQPSLLNTIKKLLGINPEDISFDVDVLINLNAAMITLFELGVISEMVTIYKDFTFRGIFGDRPDQAQIEHYLFLKTKLGFDPPTGTVLMECYKNLIAESEWRLREMQENHEFNPKDFER